MLEIGHFIGGKRVAGKRKCAVVSGGNLDAGVLASLLSEVRPRPPRKPRRPFRRAVRERGRHGLVVGAWEDMVIADCPTESALNERTAGAVAGERGVDPIDLVFDLALASNLEARFASLLTEEERSQTGPIERGAIWALGRVGPPVAAGGSPPAGRARRAGARGPCRGSSGRSWDRTR